MTTADPIPLPPLPSRDPAGHKGTFGTVLVLGGCSDTSHAMLGAPALAAIGALRAGAGLVKLLMAGPLLPGAIGICPSATGIPLPVTGDGELEQGACIPVFDRAIEGATAMVIGPGLGTGEVARALSLRSVQQEGVPVVVDADALNCLSMIPELFRDFRARAVLTPHPGEYARLASSLRIKADPVSPGGRRHAAEDLARRLGCIVVLKGAGTVVSDGQRSWTCAHANPAMATAGTGDVLSGMIAAVAGQFCHALTQRLSLWDVARLAVEAHARAGDAWVRRTGASAGLLAQELGAEIPAAMESLRA